MKATLEPADEMRLAGNYYNDDYISTNVRTGVTVNRGGTRLLALSSDFLLGLHTALTQECGEAASVVFHTCGKTWGRQFAVKFEKELSTFYDKPLNQLPLMLFEGCLVEAFSRHGWGRVVTDYSHRERGLILVELPDAIYADLLGRSDEVADPMMAGWLAGFFSHLSGQNLEAVQTQCKAMGHTTSRFILGLKDRMEPAREMVRAGKSHEEVLAALETPVGR